MIKNKHDAENRNLAHNEQEIQLYPSGDSFIDMRLRALSAMRNPTEQTNRTEQAGISRIYVPNRERMDRIGLHSGPNGLFDELRAVHHERNRLFIQRMNKIFNFVLNNSSSFQG
jgi:hypothetical protein